MRHTIFNLILLTSIALAQSKMEVVVEPEARVTKRVMFIIDVSGSMTNDNRIPVAIRKMQEITNQPIDDYEFAVIVFSDNIERWEGLPDEDTPKGWAKLPSVEAISNAQKFVSCGRDHDGTDFAPPLIAALSEPRKDLTLVLITDGIFDHAYHEAPFILNTISSLQQWREKSGLGRAVIYAIELEHKDWLKQLVKLGDGGLFYSE